jgi:hypothetical protein
MLTVFIYNLFVSSPPGARLRFDSVVIFEFHMYTEFNWLQYHLAQKTFFTFCVSLSVGSLVHELVGTCVSWS